MSQDIIRIRRDNNTNWTSVNPVLSLGEISYDTTNKQFRVGDGTTAWLSLTAIGNIVTDGDKGDIVVSSSGTTWNLDSALMTTINNKLDSGPLDGGTALVGDQVIQLRRDINANWTGVVLAAGEIGYDSTINEIRVGDGTSVWDDLDPIGLPKFSDINLQQLGDVDYPTPITVDDVLTWDGSGWINQAIPPVVLDIDELNDVTITSPQNTEVLQFNGTAWVNASLDLGGLSATIPTGNKGEITVVSQNNWTINNAVVEQANLSLVDPVSANQAATKNYTDYIGGLAISTIEDQFDQTDGIAVLDATRKVATNRLATGTASASTILRGDRVWTPFTINLNQISDTVGTGYVPSYSTYFGQWKPFIISNTSSVVRNITDAEFQSIISFSVDTITNANIGDNSINGGKLLNSTVGTSKLGGDITTAGKALLDDADAAAQRTTLGLGSLATLNTITNSEISDNTISGSKLTTDSIPLSKLDTSGTASASNFLRGDGAWSTPAIGLNQIAQDAALTGNVIGWSTDAGQWKPFVIANTTSVTRTVTDTEFTKQITLNVGTISNSNITDNTISGAKLTADSIPLSKLDTSGTASASNFLRGDGEWSTLTPTLALDDLTDVIVSSPVNLHVLSYDTTQGKWLNKTLANAGIASTVHDQAISTITSPTGVAGQVPKFLVTNSPTSGAGIFTIGYVDNTSIQDGTISVGKLNITGTANTANFLRGDGSWTNSIVTGTFTSSLNQAILKKVRNNTGSTIAKGKVVYIVGSLGDNLTVALADASTEATAATTIGITAESINTGEDGFIVCQGVLDGLTGVTSPFVDGDALWLSETTGEFTRVRPTQPAHGVALGWVMSTSAGSAGRIYVKVNNGQELDEVHDVLISSPQTGHLLSRNNTTGLWVNQYLADSNITDNTISGNKITNTTLGIGKINATGTASASTYLRGDGTWSTVSASPADGDKGDITVSGSGSTWTIDSGVVGTSKLGGDITTAGKALLDDADNAAQRTTLGLGGLATLSTVTNSEITDATISVGKLSQGTAVSGQVLGYTTLVGWGPVNASGGGAPTDAQYVVLSNNGTLTDERVLAGSNHITVVDGGAGNNATVNWRYNPKKRAVMWSDMVAAGDWLNFTSGTGTSNNFTTGSLATANNVGILNSGTGTTNAGRAGIGSASFDTIITGSGECDFTATIKIPTLSTSAERFEVYLGFSDSTNNAPIDGAFFYYKDDVNSGKWQTRTYSNGTNTNTDTGITADTNWHTFEIVINAAGTEAKFYIDGTLTNTIGTNVPTGSARGTGIVVGIQKTVGTTARNIHIDSLLYEQEVSR